MADKIAVKTLGHSGVILDQNPLEPSLPDDSLRSAQNAMHDPRLGYGGALRKRPGLKRFNSAYAGGPILGGIPMAVAGTGGAPVSGGGSLTGSDIGTGDGTGAPGGTSDGGSAAFAPAGAGAFTASTIFSGARLVALGRAASASSSGVGYYLGSRGWANAPNLTTIPAAPLAIPADPPLYSTNQDTIGPQFCLLDGWTYYQGDTTDGTGNSGAHVIRRTNGAVDMAVATIPAGTQTGATTNRFGADHFHAGSDGFIYIAVHDNNVTGTSKASRLMRLDPTTFILTEVIHTVTADAYMILPIFARFGSVAGSSRIFLGQYIGGADSNANIYISDAAGSSFSADTNVAGYDVVTCFELFNGKLWAGFRVNTAGSPSANLLASRDPNAAAGAAGAWTFHSDLSAIVENKSFIVDMQVWRDGKMYVSVFSPTNATAYIYTVDSTGLFTQVYTATSSVPFFLWNDPDDPNYGAGYLYAIGAVYGSGGGKVLTTTDGVTWGTHTALSATDSSVVGPVFIGVSQ